MNYIFRTHTAVPESTIRQILDDFILKMTPIMMDMDLDLTAAKMVILERKMQIVAHTMGEANRIKVDGFELSLSQVAEISEELSQFRKIGAIKAFRQYTRTGLREAKDMIDSFCTGPRCEAGPMAAVAFQCAFGK